MKKDFGDKKFDTRTLERSLREGQFTQKDFEKYLKDLSDESKNVEEVAVYEESETDGDSSKEPTFSV